MKTVQVLLSTYNGEKYLREQLDSLMKQEGINIKISVRDDGSTDSTIAILEEYRKDGKLIYYAEKNIGYEKSFLTIALYSSGKADYYAFCDQDDVWEPQKMITAIKKLEEIKSEKCKLYFSDLIVTDENLNKIGYKDYSKINITLGCAMARFNISGCTMVFNNLLLQLAVKNTFFERKIGHDAWIYMLCLSVGGVIVFDSNSYIMYRQHGNNVTGVQQGVIKRLCRELKVFTTKKNYMSRSAEIIYRDYFNLITKENVALLSEISTYKNSFIKTIRLLFNKDLKFGVFVVDVLIKLQILFRCY